MKTCFALPALLITLVATSLNPLCAQTGFEIKKISPEVVKTPEITFTGGPRDSKVPKAADWLQVEVDFTSSAEWVEEASFKYYIVVNGSLLVGEVTHTNIPAGENRSVMYIAPATLKRAMQGKALTNSSIENVGVEILKQGAIQATQSWKAGRPMWWQQMQQVPNLVLNKNQTPFAPLFWDRYPEIKAQAR